MPKKKIKPKPKKVTTPPGEIKLNGTGKKHGVSGKGGAHEGNYNEATKSAPPTQEKTLYKTVMGVERVREGWFGGNGKRPGHLNYALAYEMGRLHCTIDECESAFCCDRNRLMQDPAWINSYRHGWEFGKRSLRRLQWLVAEQGNVQMLIWLGKNILGQSDQITSTVHQSVVVKQQHELQNLSLKELEALRELVGKVQGQTVDVQAEEMKDIEEDPTTGEAICKPNNKD